MECAEHHAPQCVSPLPFNSVGPNACRRRSLASFAENTRSILSKDPCEHQRETGECVGREVRGVHVDERLKKWEWMSCQNSVAN